MRNRIHTLNLLILSLMLLAACASLSSPEATFTVSPALTDTPLPSPSPTPIPTPTPTATPIPPAAINLRWPEQVSALEPAFIEAALIPPPGVVLTATVRATVSDPTGARWWRGDLIHQRDHVYASEALLRFPLDPPEGNWLLFVHVQTDLDTTGEQHVAFRPAPIPFRDLSGILPEGASMRVPEAFVETVAQGDQWAGGRVWRHANGQIDLWWAPGPVKPLLLNNAVVMLEAAHDPESPPTVSGAVETTWHGQTAYQFQEKWPNVKTPGQALVIQGPDYWLYVLRTRSLDDEPIPQVLLTVSETFTFTGELVDR
jgi:hypothetical protein